MPASKRPQYPSSLFGEPVPSGRIRKPPRAVGSPGNRKGTFAAAADPGAVAFVWQVLCDRLEDSLSEIECAVAAEFGRALVGVPGFGPKQVASLAHGAAAGIIGAVQRSLLPDHFCDNAQERMELEEERRKLQEQGEAILDHRKHVAERRMERLRDGLFPQHVPHERVAAEKIEAAARSLGWDGISDLERAMVEAAWNVCRLNPCGKTAPPETARGMR